MSASLISAYATRARLYGSSFEGSFLTHNQVYMISCLLSARQELPRLSRYNALEAYAFFRGQDVDKLITELKRLDLIDDELQILNWESQS